MAADRLARFGAALAALLVAHELGDHVIQTDAQARDKASDLRDEAIQGMAGHLAGYHVAQVAALAALRPLGLRPGWRRLTAAVALSAATHGFLDRRWPVTELLERTGSAAFARPRVTIPELDVFTESPRQHDRRMSQRLGHLATPTGWGALRGTAQETQTPLPLHGPHLADQALHKAALALCALILAGGHRGS